MEKPTLYCPKCSTKMESLTFAGIEIDNCPFCNGCWLDKGEAGQMTRARGNARIQVELQDSKPSELTCPRCRSTSMLVGAHSQKTNLILDVCQKCGGIWLDRGELTTLLAR